MTHVTSKEQALTWVHVHSGPGCAWAWGGRGEEKRLWKEEEDLAVENSGQGTPVKGNHVGEHSGKPWDMDSGRGGRVQVHTDVCS